MTNIFPTAEKLTIRDRLFHSAVQALQEQGWKVERVPRSGKASVRKISRGKESHIVSIRTSQDRHIAFPRTAEGEWVTLANADYVVASSVDDRDNPRFALVHMIDGNEMRARFDRAYVARKKAGLVMPVGRGMWVSLYDEESADPVYLVGAGAGLKHPPIAKVPLRLTGDPVAATKPSEVLDLDEQEVEDRHFQANVSEDAPLTIAEAKRRLAKSLGVDESKITITITG